MKKSGFTLVELLGVIVILSAVALVSVPALLNQINNAQNKIDSSTEKIIKNAAKNYIDDNLNQYDMVNAVSYCISFDKLIEGNYLNQEIIDSNDGLVDKSVRVEYNNGLNYNIIDKNTCLTIGTEITYNPIEEKFNCDLLDDSCYSWNIISIDENNISVLMNKNLGDPVGWCNSDNSDCLTNGSIDNKQGPKTALKYLTTMTSNWKNKPRFITLNEVVSINGLDFNSSNSSVYSLNKPWLYQNLSSVSPCGYWTNEPYNNDARAAWLISINGKLGYTDIRGDLDNHTPLMGIRPVIDLSKQTVIDFQC